MVRKAKKRLAKKAVSSRRRGKLSGITRRLDAQFTKTTGPRCSRSYRSRAIALGIKVDNQLSAYAKDPAAPLCPEAQTIARYIAAKGWKVIGSQVRVQNAGKRRCTAIDLLCRDKQKAFIVIEVKTRVVSVDRHENTYMHPDPKKPTTSLGTPNTLYWRHMSQLRQTVEMFRMSKRAQGKITKGVVLVTIQGNCLPYWLRESKK